MLIRGIRSSFASGCSPLLEREAHEAFIDTVTAGVFVLSLAIILPNWLAFTLQLVVVVPFLGIALRPVVAHWRPTEKVKGVGKAVVITGCDSGFGHMLAKRLDELGFKVFAGCLFPCGEGAERLRESTSQNAHVFGLDVTKEEDVQNAVLYVSEHIGDNILWAIVCNAGILDGGEFMWTSMETIQRVVDVNAFGTVRTVKAFLTELFKTRGRVIAVTSVVARLPIPYLGTYVFSKTAQQSFCDNLRLEMYRFGVPVITIEPNAYKTPLADYERMSASVMREWNNAHPQVKQLFPSDYAETYARRRRRAFTEWGAGDPKEVVSAVVEAITAKHPKQSYWPASLWMNMCAWVVQSLPRPIIDKTLAGALESEK